MRCFSFQCDKNLVFVIIMSKNCNFFSFFFYLREQTIIQFVWVNCICQATQSAQPAGLKPLRFSSYPVDLEISKSVAD